jgi:phospholipid-binding lipoprotein MlaA
MPKGARRSWRGLIVLASALLASALLASALLAGCASTRQDPSAEIADPYEATNRAVLRSNQAVLGPVARAFHAVLPDPVHDRLSDFDANLKEPRIFANDLLQFRLDAAAKTAGRFVINTTFGIGGFYDLAGHEGLPQQSGDFGQTLYVWGVNSGPYLVLPVFGPSNARDAVGLGVDIATDPVGWALATQFGHAANVGVTGLDFATQVDQLKQAEDTSVDFYSFLRSSYDQSRRAQLREAVGLPNLVDTPADFATPADVPASPHKKPRTKARPKPRRSR